jgi:hypothetical protein
MSCWTHNSPEKACLGLTGASHLVVVALAQRQEGLPRLKELTAHVSIPVLRDLERGDGLQGQHTTTACTTQHRSAQRSTAEVGYACPARQPTVL